MKLWKRLWNLLKNNIIKMKINKFKDYDSLVEGALGAKMKRIVTGKSAGEEINKLKQSQQDELIRLYRQDPREAAKYLRSIIVKEKNSQFGLGLALTIAGAAMIVKALNIDPPKDKGHWAKVDGHDGQTQFMNKEFDLNLGPNSTRSEFIEAVANKLGGGDYAKGCENLVSGIKGGNHDEILKNLLSLKGGNPADPLKDVFSGDLGPHKGLDWGDSGVKVWVPE